MRAKLFPAVSRPRNREHQAVGWLKPIGFFFASRDATIFGPCRRGPNLPVILNLAGLGAIGGEKLTHLHAPDSAGPCRLCQDVTLCNPLPCPLSSDVSRDSREGSIAAT